MQNEEFRMKNNSEFIIHNSKIGNGITNSSLWRPRVAKKM